MYEKMGHLGRYRPGSSKDCTAPTYWKSSKVSRRKRTWGPVAPVGKDEDADWEGVVCEGSAIAGLGDGSGLSSSRFRLDLR